MKQVNDLFNRNLREAKKGQTFKAFGMSLTCYLVRNGIPYFKASSMASRMKLEANKDTLSLISSHRRN